VVQIRLRALLIVLLISLVFPLVLGIRGYLLLGGSVGLDAAQVTMRAQGLLFLGLVLALVVLLCFSYLLLRSRRIYRELDKMIDLVRFGSVSFEESLKRLGPLGEKIHLLNQRLRELNDMRSLRLSALGAINGFLLRNTPLPLLIMDVTGKITGASPRLQQRLEAENAEIQDRSVQEVLPGLDLQEVVSALEKRHVDHTVTLNKEPVTFYPIFDRENQLANIIGVVGRQEVTVELARHREEVPGTARRLSGLVRRYLRRQR
jgi:PAS domain-containing protein